jgi:uncharacterized protein (DUF924 family)
MFRDTKQAFASDGIGLQLSLRLVEREEDKRLEPAQRIFVYYCFLHDENLDMQKKGVELFESLSKDVREAHGIEAGKKYDEFVNGAKESCSLIEKFGRFPARNSILERKMRKDEEEYLRAVSHVRK